MDKEYFLANDPATLHDAIVICRNRDERLLKVDSQAEQDYITNTIIKPARKIWLPKWYVSSAFRPHGDHIWLGATNLVGTNKFKWLDESEMTYSNWEDGKPSLDLNQRNGIVMAGDVHHPLGQWFDYSVNALFYVLCEKTIFALKSNLIEQTKHFNSTVKQFDARLNAVIGISKSREVEFVNLIGDVEHRCDNLRNQFIEFFLITTKNVERQTYVSSKLGDEANYLAFEVESNKKQSKQLIGDLTKDVEKSNKIIESLKNQANINKKQNEMLIHKTQLLIEQNKSLEVRLRRLELKISTNIEDNSNKLRS